MTTYTYTTHHSTAIASLLLALCYASAFAHSHAHSHEGCVCVCVGFFAHRIMRFPSMGRRVLQSIFARYTCASICTCNWPSFARRHCSPAISRRFVLCVQTNWLRSHSVSSARSQQNTTHNTSHPLCLHLQQHRVLAVRKRNNAQRETESFLGGRCVSSFSLQAKQNIMQPQM